MTSEQIVAQFQQILSTMQRIVAASADVAERVDQLEEGRGEVLGRLTEVQGSLQLLLEQYQTHTRAESQKMDTLIRTVEALEARLASLEGRQVN